MNGKNINLEDKKFKKSDIYKNKKVNRIDFITPLCVRLPQMIGYARKFDENTTTSFRVTDKKFLKNYCKIWEKIEKLILKANQFIMMTIST